MALPVPDREVYIHPGSSLLIAAISAAIIAPVAHSNTGSYGIHASQPTADSNVAHNCVRAITAQGFRQFTEAVWAPNRWRRGSPPQRIFRAQRKQLRCAGPERRRVMLRMWVRDRRRFYAHRRAELWRERVTPFYGGGHWWALPYPMVVCESSAIYTQPYGAYSILDPAWREWGGRTAHAGEASPREQDLVAHHGWLIYGEGAWECKGDGHPHPF